MSLSGINLHRLNLAGVNLSEADLVMAASSTPE
ncbi:pentapeptide repeat-containing protein [Enterobacter ludwigii]